MPHKARQPRIFSVPRWEADEFFTLPWERKPSHPACTHMCKHTQTSDLRPLPQAVLLTSPTSLFYGKEACPAKTEPYLGRLPPPVPHRREHAVRDVRGYTGTSKCLNKISPAPSFPADSYGLSLCRIEASVRRCREPRLWTITACDFIIQGVYCCPN